MYICYTMFVHPEEENVNCFLKKTAALGQKCDAFTNQYIEYLFAFEHGFFEYLIVWVLNIHPERNYYFIRVQWKNYRIFFFLE